MMAWFESMVCFCFRKAPPLYGEVTRPATPRAKLALRTAHPGGLLVFRTRPQAKGGVA